MNIDYIIETYCVNKEEPELKCNGKCHLATQLAINTNDLDKDTPYLVSFFEAFFPVYFQEYNPNYQLKITEKQPLTIWAYTSEFKSLFKDCLDPPPQV